MSHTYVIGKLGKSIKFDPNAWGAIGGDNEAPSLYLKLAKLNPNDTFIMIGKSDLSKLKDKPHNLHCVWEHFVPSGGNIDISTPDGWKKFSRDPTCSSKHGQVEHIVEHLKDVKVDGGIIFGGPTGETNFFNKVYTMTSVKEGKPEFAKTLLMHYGYSGPIYHYLNESKIPWIMINNDPRYLKLGRDMLNLPKEILSQYDSAKMYRPMPSFEIQSPLNECKIEYKYAGVEKIFLIDKVIDSNTVERTEKFMIVLNEGNHGVSSRYKKLKEYVLDHVEDVAIYGKWADNIVKNDLRFKGSIKFEELQAKLLNVKYSFMISITDGWVTMKVWELIGNGIIPFLHPNYDTQHHVNLPAFLRLEKPGDLIERIQQLENDPELYQSLLSQCKDLIKEGDTNGQNLNSKIFSAINKYSSPSDGTKSYDEVLKEINDNNTDLTQFLDD
jgi:hypothetical protein